MAAGLKADVEENSVFVRHTEQVILSRGIKKLLQICCLAN